MSGRNSEITPRRRNKTITFSSLYDLQLQEAQSLVGLFLPPFLPRDILLKPPKQVYVCSPSQDA